MGCKQANSSVYIFFENFRGDLLCNFGHRSQQFYTSSK
jgi:hypothetical protein